MCLLHRIRFKKNKNRIQLILLSRNALRVTFGEALNHFKCFVCGQWGKPEHAYLGKNLSEKNRELINSIHMIPNPQIKFGIQWYNQSTSCGFQLMKVYRALLDNCLNNNHLPLSGWSKAGNIMAYGGFFSV